MPWLRVFAAYATPLVDIISVIGRWLDSKGHYHGPATTPQLTSPSTNSRNLKHQKPALARHLRAAFLVVRTSTDFLPDCQKLVSIAGTSGGRSPRLRHPASILEYAAVDPARRRDLGINWLELREASDSEGSMATFASGSAGADGGYQPESFVAPRG